jgi:hypothetical protein
MHLEMSKSIYIYILISTSMCQHASTYKDRLPALPAPTPPPFPDPPAHFPLPIPLPAGSAPADRPGPLGYLQDDISDLIRSPDLGLSNLRPGLPIFSPQVRAT